MRRCWSRCGSKTGSTTRSSSSRSARHDEIRALYSKRAVSHPSLTLALCIVRIGKLAPDPGGLAVWTLPSYGALAAIARDLDDISEPVRLTTAGVYNDVGREIL